VRRFEELDGERYGELFRGLLDRGVYLAPSPYECMFPSLAHGDDEIDATIEAVDDILGR
jgi:glutamate-1-semialdehyde 2,1-aminomutase